MNIAADKAGDHPGQHRWKILSAEEDSHAGREPFVQDAFAALWREKRTMFASLCVALIVSGVALVLIPPRYTGEAIIRLNFGSQETSGAAAKAQNVATPDAAALVESAARIVGSRAVASAVVDQLGLDRDPRFAHESTPSRSYMAARSALGLQRGLRSSRVRGDAEAARRRRCGPGARTHGAGQVGLAPGRNLTDRNETACRGRTGGSFCLA